jgi:DinB superfamily
MARTDLDLITYASGRLIGRLEGLDDDEYLWEPVPDCWSVRPADGGGWHADLGPGGETDTPRTPAPFTTIAWRLWHLGASPRPTWPPTGDLRGRELVLAYFGQPRADTAPAVGTADEARTLVAAHWERLAATVAGFSDDELEAKIGQGPYAEATTEALVLHIADELIHHGAEVGVLRDLYANRPAQSVRG